MNNKLIIVLTFGIIITFGTFMLNSGNNVQANTRDVTGSNQGEYQKIVIGMQNYNYYPNTITVKVNKPVRIYLDSSVQGCFRSFVIRDFGISYYLQSVDDYIEFTPTKTGTFGFSCSMGMGTGTLIVE